MNKKKGVVCGSSHTVKNGIRKGVQLYKRRDCGYQFRAGTEVSEDVLGMPISRRNKPSKSFLIASA